MYEIICYQPEAARSCENSRWCVLSVSPLSIAIFRSSASDKRYTCSHVGCLPGPDKDPVFFGTWTTLQAHIRNDHPPTCMHPSCTGRTFASQHNLRAHQKLHEQQEVEALLRNGVNGSTPGDATDPECCQPRKRRRGGELGRDWKCDFAGCEKDFKSVRCGR
jgi:general transcription factor IIIA